MNAALIFLSALSIGALLLAAGCARVSHRSEKIARQLQEQLAHSERRFSSARRDFNESYKRLRFACRSFAAERDRFKRRCDELEDRYIALRSQCERISVDRQRDRKEASRQIGQTLRELAEENHDQYCELVRLRNLKGDIRRAIAKS